MSGGKVILGLCVCVIFLSFQVAKIRGAVLKEIS